MAQIVYRSDPDAFAIVLGCADARVPIELVFGRSVNDLLVLLDRTNVDHTRQKGGR